MRGEVDKVIDGQVEQFPIPTCVFRDPVVGKDVCALLRFGQLGDANARHMREAELPGGLQPTVAGEDRGVFVNDDRYRKPDMAD